MPLAASSSMPAGRELIATLREAVAAVEALLARCAPRGRGPGGGRRPLGPRAFDREQRATHGLAWLATYVEAIRQLAAYAERLAASRGLGEIEELLVRIGAGEYLAQILGGIPMSQGEIVRLSDLGLSPAAVAARVTPAVEHLIASGNTAPRRARLAELMRERQEATVGACGLDETLEFDPRGDAQIRRRQGRAARAGLASAQRIHPARCHRADGGARRVQPDHPRGLRRHGARQGIDVRRLRGVVARLYRRRQPRHPLRDRRRTDPRQRHRGAETQVAAEDRLRRSAADGGVHRAEHRLRPCVAEDARGAPGRCLQGLRQQDLDHASGARRSDDAPGAHQSGRERLSRPVHAARRKAARQRRQSVSRIRHVRHRDRGARLSRHEGIRDRLRRLCGEGREPPRRRRRARLQATDGDLRGGAHPDRGARHRRGAGGDGAGARLCHGRACSSASRSPISRALPTSSP